MSINHIKCERCNRGWRKPEFKVCFNCYKEMNKLATVVYDLEGDKDEYFRNNPSHIPVSLLPAGVIPDKDFCEVYASQLK